MKIVVNRCYGGFALSKKAIERLAEMGNDLAIKELQKINSPDYDNPFPSYGFDFDPKHMRINSDLINVVEELGKEANAYLSDLEIIDIPDDVDWEIDRYDGWERIAEKHRIW